MAHLGGSPWWSNAIVYQIYPRSFADSNDDGIGDLGGVRSRLPYLYDLGVDAIWLTPFYPSPLADGGYDIADHRDVDPRLGSLDEFDALLADAHELGLKVMVDVVPNHTSIDHHWFRAALAAPVGSPERDRFVFRPGLGAGQDQPPSDWRSHFGGSAWEPVGDGQWYLHLFAKEQPDLNWDNPEVRADFLRTLRFWADRGVDGFRVDVAHAVAKDLAEPLRSQPNLDAALPVDGSDPLYDRDEVHEIYRSWRVLFDSYDPPRCAVAETWTPTNERTYLYARPSELGQVFDFSMLKSAWDATRFVAVIARSLADHARFTDDAGGLTWVLSSHDVVRHASRLALPVDVAPEEWTSSEGTAPRIDLEVGVARAGAATMLMLALPGTAYLFQGEELGLPDIPDLPHDRLQDPIWTRTAGAVKGRDGCRVPLPWRHDAPHFGFSDTAEPWLPQPDLLGAYAADLQSDDPASTLSLYRNALELRRKLQTADGTVEWLSSGEHDVVHFRRSNGWESVTNFSAGPRPMPPGVVVLVSRGSGERLEAYTTAWVMNTAAAEPASSSSPG